MNIGPIELIIIFVICCIPVVIAAVAGIIFAIVKLTAKDEPQDQ